jgi:hypothetical protein
MRYNAKGTLIAAPQIPGQLEIPTGGWNGSQSFN